MNGGSLTTLDGPQPLGVNKMIRARVFDKSGQSWTHEVWVYIKNAGSYSKKFLLGFITEKNDNGDVITFTARLLFSLTLDTIEPVVYKAGEQLIVSKDNKFGYIATVCYWYLRSRCNPTINMQFQFAGKIAQRTIDRFVETLSI